MLHGRGLKHGLLVCLIWAAVATSAMSAAAVRAEPPLSILNEDCTGIFPVDLAIRSELLMPSGWLERATGSDSALSANPVYYGEVFTNTRGGQSTNGATQYEGLIDVPMSLNLEQMRRPLPGTVFLRTQNTHGRGITEGFVGDTQVVSNIDSFNNIMQVSEYWWEFNLFDDRLTVRLGKQDLNTEFLLMETASDFIQSSFGLSPSTGFPSYPNQSMAVVLLAQLSDSLTCKVGVWDGFANGGSWGISGNNVMFHFAEMDYTYALSDGQLPGKLELGLAYTPGGDVSNVRLPRISGFYIQLEQLIVREHPCDQKDSQGLGMFVSYFPRSFSDDTTLDVILGDLVAGIVYTGLIPGRDQDVTGAGIARARLNQGGTNQETVVELFYQAQITDRISLQPDFQYIASPSGIYRDALAVGLRFQMSL